MIKLKRGLDVPISGEPTQVIKPDGKNRQCLSVAVLGADYIGVKPTMQVKEGEQVKLGQCLFTDKKNPKVKFTAPGAGTVTAINRGDKRVFLSVVIDLKGGEALTFNAYPQQKLNSLDREHVVENLLESGLWTALRTRPYSRVPDPDSSPASIFVTAIDTNPLAADPAVILANEQDAFRDGLIILSRLANKVFVCKAPTLSVPDTGCANVYSEDFLGPHPAGLAGTHIHFLDPVGDKKSVWTINYQDVIAIGKLFLNGQLNVERVIALAGPQVESPRLVQTRIGANIQELVAGELLEGENRIISGSILSGRTAYGVTAYLGRYHQQVSVLREGRERELLSYLRPGVNKHSVMNMFVSKLVPHKKFAFTTTTNGSERAMVPTGNFEAVMPLDILPTQLLRSLIVGDTEMAQALGCLELDEEDLALCTYVCSGKYEYGAILRDNLTRIEKEG